MRHIPPRHARPAAQKAPSQHVCPSAPQATGVVQALFEQMSPVPQIPPSQQGCRAEPHMGAATQLPPAQLPPGLQEFPTQQSWPIIPHATELSSPPLPVSPL